MYINNFKFYTRNRPVRKIIIYELLRIFMNNDYFMCIFFYYKTFSNYTKLLNMKKFSFVIFHLKTNSDYYTTFIE